MVGKFAEERHAVTRGHERHAVGPLDDFRRGLVSISEILQLDEEHADALTTADEAETRHLEDRVDRFVLLEFGH